MELNISKRTIIISSLKFNNKVCGNLIDRHCLLARAAAAHSAL